jgi:DNA gyrase subunit A
MEPLIRLIADPRHTVSEAGTYRLSEEQARAILELRLQRLTALGRDEIADELRQLGERIADYLDILRSRERVLAIIKDELIAIKDEFATPRRTEIVEAEFEVEDEDLIQREEMVVTVSHRGYIKRVPLSTYRAQRRGGKGRAGMSTREEDFVSQLFVANTHTPVLFFSSAGMVYRMKVWRLPVGTPQARGKAMINLLPLAQGETITSILPMSEDEESWGAMHLMFATRSGNVRRNELADFIHINRSGKIAMKLDEGDQIVGVRICSPDDDVLLVTANGRCIRFPVDDVRVFAGRTSTGVRGIRLGKDAQLGVDEIISITILRHVDAEPAEARAYVRHANAMRRAALEEDEPDAAVVDSDVGDNDDEADEDAGEEAALTPERYAELGAAEQFLLTVSENGYGKRSSAFEYRVTGRGGKGIIAMAVTPRNGHLVASFPIDPDDQIMLVTDGGQLIRCPVNDIRVAGRSTQGVTIFNTAQDETVVSVERVSEVDVEVEDEPTDDGNGGAGTQDARS